MAISTNLVSGLASGFDWRSMIDQLMELEHRPIDLKENRKSEYEQKLSIIRDLNTRLLTFKTQADTLSKNESFNVFKTSLTTDSATYSASDFLSVTTNENTAPGTHTITMNSSSSLAQARKISSKSFTTYDTALSLSGEFVINGRALQVETSDDLQDIMNKINNLNSGSNATGVTASILTVSSSNYRLVLTSENTGEDAFTIFDAGSDAQNILNSGLGFTNGTTSVKNYISTGVQSEAFSSSTQSVGSMLGLTTMQTGTTVTIGSVNNVTIDLSKSLTEIAADINTAVAATNITASVVSSTEDGETTYRLKIENTTTFTDDNHVLETLGILEGNHSNVAEVHLSDTAVNKVGGGYMDATTAFNLIDTGSGVNNVATGDTITLFGTKHDGTAVASTSFSIYDAGAYKTVDDLLTEIESQFGLGAGSAVVVDGKIQITDNVTGDSQLEINLVYNNEGGGTLNLGTISASQEGYDQQLQEGTDANVIIDGTAINSSSNILTDAIAGVTLNLKTIESGKTVILTITRDNDSIKTSVQDLLDSYNDVIQMINEQFTYDEESESAGILQGDATLYSIKASLTSIITEAITGLPSSLNALSLVGINSTVDYTDHLNDGKLTIDDTVFMEALESNFNGFRRVFAAEGSTTDGDVEYVTHSNETVAGEYEVNITQAATQSTVTGTEVLTAGIGATDIETLTITEGGKVAVIVLNGASGENGSSIDNIVNTINSELATEYTQSLMGNIKNTTDAGQTTAITSSTTWDAIYSGGVSANLADDDVITFSGHTKNGASVNGSYTISDADGDTVQELLSAIESAFNNEVSASLNTYGYLVITDKTSGTSQTDLTVTGPTGKNLDFGAVTTSNLLGSVRNTSSGSAITESTTWGNIDGNSLAGGEVITFAGYTSNGEAVEGSYTVNLGENVGNFLSAIESAYGGAVDAQIQDGRVVLTDGTSNSTLGIQIFEPDGSDLNFGTMTGGTTGRYAVNITASKDGSDHLVLTHDDYGSSATFTVSQSGTELGLGAVTEGKDVAGTINGEAATGLGQILTGDAPETGQTTSIEGLVIKYTGTDTGLQGTVKITMGAAELLDRAIYDMVNTADGYVDFRIESMMERIDDIDDQISEMESRLERKMELMINRFVAMELALSQIQSMSDWLSGQINAANSGWS